MFDIFGNIKSLLKIQTVCIDNNIFRMHYQLTLVLLVLFSIIVNSRQYFGDPIDCTADAKVERVIDNYCWMHIFKSYGPADEEHKLQHGTHYTQSRKYSLTYYQWVGFALFFQAILFFIPRYLWRYCWEEGKIKGLTSGMKGPSCDADQETSRKKLILDYLQRNIGNHNLYFFRYIFCEILNLINVILQMFFMDAFLGYAFTTYGSKIFGLINEIPESRGDPMNDVFPKVAYCTFTRVGDTGRPVNHESLCVLPVNIFNEKIYCVLWFWFIALATITSLGLCYRLVTFVPTARGYILHRKTKAVDIRVTKSVTDHIAVGDWFLIYQIGKNMDSLVFGELLQEFGDRVVDHRYHELDEFRADSQNTNRTSANSFKKENNL